MARLKALRLMFIPAALGAMALLAACGTVSTPAAANGAAANGATGGTTPAGGGASAPSPNLSNLIAEARAAGVSFAPSPDVGGGYSQSGIHVNGLGVATVKPDLAVVSLGVQASAKTVAQARQEAAEAMDKVVKALRALGIAESDITTQWFNINPRYEHRNVYRCPDGVTPVPATRDGMASSEPYPMKAEPCYQTGESVLTGYDVTNQIQVKVRDLDKTSAVIDDAAKAAGDLVRVHGISFTVDNPKAAETRAREAAVKDAMAKAKQFADLTGAKLGKLAFISESGGYYPMAAPAMARGAYSEAAKDMSTPINPGTLDVTVSIIAVFNIE